MKATKATKAMGPNWATLLATCGLCLSAVAALAAKDKPTAPAAAPAAAGPAAEAPAACPAMDPAAKKGPPIDINTASALDLRCGLDGINEAMANKIVDNRPYSKVDELLDRKLLNSGMFQKIQSRVTASDPGGAGKPATKPK